MTIAIDFDSTLFPTMEKVLEIYNERHSTNIELSQHTTYSFHDCFLSEIADELLGIFVEKDVYDNLQPYKGAARAIRFLMDRGHEVYIATASDVRNMEWKEELLQKYFPFIPKNNLIRIYNKSMLNIDMLIEDNLDNLKNTLAERVCFNQPWNVDDGADYVYGIYRIHHWGEIINIINEIERKDKEWENV
jgi:5'(3')-deoxyribonucleotidase